jgi:hypothetical protein
MSLPLATSFLTSAIIELERAADLLEAYATRFYPDVPQSFIAEMQDAFRGRADYLREQEAGE